MSINNKRGFTLIEILVALFIFAIVGTLAAMSLHSILVSNTALKKVDREITQLQITMTLLRNDTRQAIDRSIRNSDGKIEPAFLASGTSYIFFTRTGIYDPFDTLEQSNMQRIGYILHNHNFVRLTWNSLDQDPQSKPHEQILLKQVESISWQFIARDNSSSSLWPPATGSTMQTISQSNLPKAVLLVIHLQKKGVIQGVFPIPARGAYAK